MAVSFNVTFAGTYLSPRTSPLTFRAGAAEMHADVVVIDYASLPSIPGPSLTLVETFVACEADLWQVLLEHQERTRRPVRTLLEDMPVSLVADLHEVQAAWNLLPDGIARVCRCRSCEGRRREVTWTEEAQACRSLRAMSR